MAAPLADNINLANALASLGTFAFGKPTGTTTKQTQFNSTAINALMQQLLGASGLSGTGRTGLSKTRGMQKGAGLYNSSTQGLLDNDLMSRITGEIAIAGAPTVTKNEQPGALSGGLGSLILPLTLLGMTDRGKKLFKGVGSTVDEGLDSILGAMGMGPNVGINAGVEAASLSSSIMPASAADMSSMLGVWDSVGSGSGADFTTGASASGSMLFSGMDAGSTLSAADFNWSNTADFGDMTGDIFGDAADASGATGSIPYLGSIYDASQGNYGSAAGSAIGTAIMPGIGTMIGSLIGSGFDDCFITTAIMKSLGNTDDNGQELTLLRAYRDSWLRQNHPEAVEEYYQIAPAIVERISALPDADTVWHQLYKIYLSPALQQINAGNPDDAYETYKSMVMAAKEIA